MNGYFYFEIQADDTQRAIKFYKIFLDGSLTKLPGFPLNIGALKRADLAEDCSNVRHFLRRWNAEQMRLSAR